MDATVMLGIAVGVLALVTLAVVVLLGELAQKGVDRELIDQAASELEAERDYEVASGFATRKAAGLAGLEPSVRYRRLAGALARRGFSASVVAQVTREALAGLREPEDFD